MEPEEELKRLEFKLISKAQAHGGGLDSSGGHNCYVGSCKGTYHYHQKATKPSNSFNEPSDGWLGPLVVLVLILMLVGAFLKPFKKKADDGGYGAKGVHFALQAIISMAILALIIYWVGS